MERFKLDLHRRMELFMVMKLILRITLLNINIPLAMFFRGIEERMNTRKKLLLLTILLLAGCHKTTTTIEKPNVIIYVNVSVDCEKVMVNE